MSRHMLSFPPKLRIAALTALAPISWGTTYLVTTQMLPAGRPLLAGVLRALPAGIVLAAVGRRRPLGWWWARAFVLGVLNIGGFFALLFVAAYRLPGGIAAAVGAVQPLVAAGLAAVLVRERLRPAVVLAGALGVAGVAALIARSPEQLDAVGVAAALAGAAAMATGVVLTKKWPRPVPLLAFTSWQLIAGGTFLLPIAFVAEGIPSRLTTTNLGGYLWLTTIGTAVAYSLWFRGIPLLPVASTSILGLLSPTVATILGWLALDQSLNPTQLAGVIAILAAVVIVQTTTPHAQPSPAIRRPTTPSPHEASSATPRVDRDHAPTMS